MRTDSDRNLSAEADPNPARKTRERVLTDAAEKYGMMMDFCGGALGFTSEESLQEQNKKMGGNGI